MEKKKKKEDSREMPRFGVWATKEHTTGKNSTLSVFLMILCINFIYKTILTSVLSFDIWKVGAQSTKKS